MAIIKSLKDKKTKSTTSLPKNLLDEINEKDGKSTSTRRSFTKSRKDIRKEKRNRSKLNNNNNNLKVLDPNDARTQGKDSYQRPSRQLNHNNNNNNTNNNTNNNATKNKNVDRKAKAFENLVDMSSVGKRKSDPEDDEIKWLEYQLKNQKNNQNDLRDDLDDLLDDVEGLENKIFDDGSDVDMNGDDDVEDNSDINIDENVDEEVGENDNEIEQSFDDDETVDEDLNEIEEDNDEDEDARNDESIKNNNQQNGNEDERSQNTQQQSAKYVPPAIRAAREREQQSNSNTQKMEELQKISKVVKGSLNRLSESNIETILNALEDLYRSKPRHDVTSTITDLVMVTIGSKDNMLDSFVVLYAGFITALYKIIGIEFIAHFIQTVIQKLDSKPLSKHFEGDTKQNLNLVSMLAELYNMGSISTSLIYDIVKSLINENKDGEMMEEAQIDAILRIIRSAGQQMRHDDPTSLKEIVIAVQHKLESVDPASLSSRFKFMLECLNNLKNNKLKSLPGGTGGEESRTRLRKYLKNLSKKPGVSANDPLTVSLQDLRDAESKGKWWLVGSAWGGNPLLEKKSEFSTASKTKNEDDIYLKLAKKQGMNTDVRRNIFIALMTSEDYIDACEKLSKLGLSETQQREIIRVILHCSGNEKSYNPFYALVASNLLRQSHSTRITLQYAIWDFLRELGEVGVGGAEILKHNSNSHNDGSNVRNSRIDNIARSTAWWIAKSSVSLSMFKPVVFPTLGKKGKIFFNKLFTYLILSTQSHSPLLSLDLRKDKTPIEAIMMKTAPFVNLSNGLRWFFDHIEYESTLNKNELDIVKWGIKLSNETLKVGMSVVEEAE